MAQLKILNEDTRYPLVPYLLQKLIINVEKHSILLKTLPEENSGN